MKSTLSRLLVPVLLVTLLTMSPPGEAQAQVAGAEMTLADAISIARRHNPDYLSQRNREIDADWSTREAYGQLLPSLSIGGGLDYQGAGEERFGASLANQNRTGYLSSSYMVGLNYRLAGETLLAPRHQNANRTAILAQIELAEFDLRAEVTRQYLAVRRAQDAVGLARQELESADESLRLVEARAAVGIAISLDARQAEVERGRAEVELLRAENLAITEALRLAEILGVEIGPNLELTTEFQVFEPGWTRAELRGIALTGHPQLRALRASAAAGGINVRMAQSGYLPTLSLSAGFTGYAQRATNPEAIIDLREGQLRAERQSCLEMNMILENLTTPMPRDCSASNFQLSSSEISRIRRDNSGLPLDFNRQPFGLSLQLSIPVFNGFSRERRLAAARAAESDTRHQLRREELHLNRVIATAHQDLTSAYRAVQLEERNRDLAASQLELARERYTVGSISFIELKDAETMRARADRAYLAAVYTFHDSLAALERAVGSELPTRVEGRR